LTLNDDVKCLPSGFDEALRVTYLIIALNGTGTRTLRRMATTDHSTRPQPWPHRAGRSRPSGAGFHGTGPDVVPPIHRRRLHRPTGVSCKFLAEVHAGDTLYTQLEIIDLAAHDDAGEVTTRATIHYHHGQLVLDGEHTYPLKTAQQDTSEATS
jgi:hypothetical protein